MRSRSIHQTPNESHDLSVDAQADRLGSFLIFPTAPRRAFVASVDVTRFLEKPVGTSGRKKLDRNSLLYIRSLDRSSAELHCSGGTHVSLYGGPEIGPRKLEQFMTLGRNAATSNRRRFSGPTVNRFSTP